MGEQQVLRLLSAAPRNSLGDRALGEAFRPPFPATAPLLLRMEADGMTDEAVAPALARLTQLPEAVLPNIERAVFAFYEKEVSDGSANFDTPQDQLDWEASQGCRLFRNPVVPTRPSEIWSLVSFNRLFPRRNWAGTRMSICVGGQAAWDGEHGIVLYFENGSDFFYVGSWGDTPREWMTAP
jgi:hypothetical protein